MTEWIAQLGESMSSGVEAELEATNLIDALSESKKILDEHIRNKELSDEAQLLRLLKNDRVVYTGRQQLLYPAKTFSDLFIHHRMEKPEKEYLRPMHTKGKYPATESYVSGYCALRGYKEISMYVVPRQKLVEVIERHTIGVDYDRMYFEIINRGDNEALVVSKYNLIIGGRWLAVIDADSVPVELKERRR